MKIAKVTKISQHNNSEAYLILSKVAYVEKCDPKTFYGAEIRICLDNGTYIYVSKVDAQRVLSGIEGTIIERADDMAL